MSLLTTRNTPALDDRYGPAPRAPRFRFPLHPLLCALFPPLAIYASDPLKATPFELLTGCAICLLITTTAWGLLTWLYRSGSRAALAATGLAASCFSFGVAGLLVEQFAPWGITIQPTWLAALWCLLPLAGVLWLRKPQLDPAPLNAWGNLFAGVLVAGPLLLAGVAWARNPGLILAVAPLASAEPVPADWTPPHELPDIYYLSVRRYPNYRTLSREGGIDNRPFLRALVQRGFVIATRSHSNYPRHDLTLATALRLDYFPSDFPTRQDSALLLRGSRAMQILRPLGYTYGYLAACDSPVRRPPDADRVFGSSPFLTPFGDRLAACTPIPALLGSDEREQWESHRRWIIRQAATGSPTLTVAELNLAVPPLSKPGERAVPPPAALEETNRRLLELIDELLRHSSITPIIILQAEEGPLLQPERDAGRPRAELVRKRCGILTAVLLPADKRAAVPLTLSPVNSFRLALREGLNAPIELLPDRVHYWQPTDEFGRADAWQPCRLVDATAEVFGPPRPDPGTASAKGGMVETRLESTSE